MNVNPGRSGRELRNLDTCNPEYKGSTIGFIEAFVPRKRLDNVRYEYA